MGLKLDSEVAKCLGYKWTRVYRGGLSRWLVYKPDELGIAPFSCPAFSTNLEDCQEVIDRVSVWSLEKKAQFYGLMAGVFDGDPVEWANKLVENMRDPNLVCRAFIFMNGDSDECR